MDFSVIRDNWEYLLFGTFPDGPLEGAALTLVISLIAGAISVVLGTIGGVMLAMLRGWWVNLFAAFLGFFRAIPIIMLIFWVYFLLPIAFGVDVPEITT
ncbi:ABC transporter permease subunit, partial [Morganella morganii]